MRWGALAAFGFGLLVAGVLGASLVGLGCDENVREAVSARSDVCTAVGELGAPRWWLLACAPALLFVAGALVKSGRDRLAGLAAAIFVLFATVDAVLVAIVTSNLLA